MTYRGISVITPLSIRRGVGGEASVNSVCRRPSVGSKRWWKSSVKSVWSVREKNVLRERKTSYASHKQANRGNLTYYSPLQSERGWGWGLCELCMPKAFCGLEMCAKNLRELCALCERKNSMTCASSPIGVTSHTTPLSIRRGAGGEASVFSVCRRRSVGSKCAPKTSVNSVRSVREKTRWHVQAAQ